MGSSPIRDPGGGRYPNVFKLGKRSKYFSLFIFVPLTKRFKEIGNVLNVKELCRNYSLLNRENKPHVLGTLVAYPISAIGIVYQQAAISRGEVHIILKKFK